MPVKKQAVCLFLLLCQFASAQTAFQETVGGTGTELAYQVQLTFDGGYAFCGNTSSFGVQTSDVYLVKTSSAGDTIWTKTYGGTNDDRGYSIAQTADSGFIICGRTGIAFDNDVIILRLNATGDLLWSRRIGGTGNDLGYCVIQSADLGFMIAGSTNSFGAGLNDGYLIKTDASGDTLWTRTLGGVQNDEIRYVEQTDDGGYILAGTTLSAALWANAWLSKVDGFGNLVWSKIYGTPSYDAGYAVAETHDGGFVIAGEEGTTGSMYLNKTDSSGNLVWTYSYGGPGPDHAYGVQRTRDDGFMITGTTQNFGVGGLRIYLVKTDSAGTLEWSRVLGETDTASTTADGAYHSRQTSDGGYIIGGFTTSFGLGGYDILIFKIDSAGNGPCYEIVPPTIAGIPPTVVSDFIPASAAGGIIIPDTFTVGNGGIADNLCPDVGVTEPAGPDIHIRIVPNPANHRFTIIFPHPITEGTVALYDLPGIRLLEEPFSNTIAKEISIAKIPAGIYLLNVHAGTRSFLTKLIVTRD